MLKRLIQLNKFNNKKMKKLLFTLIAVGITVTQLIAQNITKNYNFGNITEISAGFIYKVYVTKGKTSNIEVTYPKEIEKFIEVTHNNFGKLILRNPLNKGLNYSKEAPQIIVRLQMEKINDIELSGAAKLFIEEDSQYSTDELDIELSGASSIPHFTVVCNELSIEMSGATNLAIKGEFKEIDIETSGASNLNILSSKPVNSIESEVSGACKINMVLSSNEYKGEFSGACNHNLDGNFNSVWINSSGACNFNLVGNVQNYMEIDLSGACKLNADKFIVQNANVTLTGASKAEVTVKENLNVNISRTSKFIYHGNPRKFVDMSPYRNIVKAD